MVKAKAAETEFTVTLKRLRRKFVAITMGLSVAILAVAFATILVVEYNQRMSEVNTALDEATQDRLELANPDTFDWNMPPDGQMGPGGDMPPMDNSGGTISILPPDSQSGMPQGQGMPFDEDAYEDDADDQFESDNDASEELAEDRASEYDDLTMNVQATNGRLIAISSYRVDANDNVLFTYADTFDMDDDVLTEALSALDLENAIDSQGTLKDLGLYYRLRATEDSWRVAFVPTSYVTSSLTALGSRLAGIGAITLIALFIASLFLSRWALRPVGESWKQQQQFIADASHELKTPLTVILANSSIIKTQKDQTVESQMQWLDSTETEAHLMQELVEDLLFLAKPTEVRKAQELPQRIDFSNIVWEQALQFESVAFENNIELEEDIADDLFVTGVEKSVRRVTGVLLDNACKYAGDQGRVKVKLARVGEMAQLSVNNTGSVIDPEDLPHVFDRFYRADKARVRDKGSFGLGLAIAREIVTDMDGQIRVASTPEAGTTFTVELKLA